MFLSICIRTTICNNEPHAPVPVSRSSKRRSVTYGAETPVFLICFSCIFCCLRFIPTWHAVSKSVSASSSIGLIHRPHKFPNSFFQCPSLSFFIIVSAISPSSLRVCIVRSFSSSSSSFIVLKEHASDK